MISKLECIGISAATAVVVGLVVAAIFNKKPYKVKAAIGLALVVFALGVVLCLTLDKKHEKFTSSSTSSDGCTQNINITQNCPANGGGGGHKPWTPDRKALSKSAVKAWIKKVNPDLTSQCVDCVIDSVVKMWDGNTLEALEHKSMEDQKNILDALLVFDCNKECAISPATLHPNVTEVEKWLSLLLPGMEPACFKCVANAISKSWNIAQFNDMTKHRSKEQQVNQVKIIWALKCTDCNITKLSPAEVEAWLTTQLTGAKTKCYNCLVMNIVRMWDRSQFEKIKKMNAKSRRQVIQAMISLNCLKECVYVPTGLTKAEVQDWLVTVLQNENYACMNCLVDFIVKNWTLNNFNYMKMQFKKNPVDAGRVLALIMTLDCKAPCVTGKLSKGEILDWVKGLLSHAKIQSQAGCENCIVTQVFDNYNKHSFNELKKESTADQVKKLYQFAEFNCPHMCKLDPLGACAALPY